jgi:DNA polymerase-1
MTKKIFVIDGYGFLFRAYHSLPALTSPNKVPIGAIYGFVSMILKVFESFKPSHAVMVFDSGQKNFRHELYSEYKSHRPPAPDDLIPQFAIAREAAREMGFPIMEKIGYEADDIIASIVKTFPSHEIVIISSDKDLMQLISDKVCLYDGMKNKYIRSLEVLEKFGVGPEKVVDILAIMGDASDNIPGIPGIGPKGAAELIGLFGSLENILKNADSIKQNARRKAVLENKEKALLSKKLVMLDYDIDLGVTIEDLELKTPDHNLQAFFDLYGLKNLKSRAEKIMHLSSVSHKQSSLSRDSFIQFIDQDAGFAHNNSIKKLCFDLKSLIKQNHDADFSVFEDLSLMNYTTNAGNPQNNDSYDDVFAAYQELLQRLHEHSAFELYYDFDLPFANVLAHLELIGIKVDAKILQELSEEFTLQLEEISKNIYDLSGEEFNIASPKQLAEVLFQKLQLPKSKKSDSTNADVLEDLSSQGFVIADHVLKWRQISKLKNTYTDVLPKQINPETGRIHSSFSQISTSTSRISSTNPNLQNIPIRSEYGERIRSSFIPEKGYKLVSADYSQVELRLLAHVANINALIHAFKNGEDIHSKTAEQIFGSVNKDLRRAAKAINFGIIYGISPFGLAKQLNIPQKQAANYIEKYFALYPGIKEYMDNTIKFARENGYVRNIFGRKCFVPEINSKNWALRGFSERAAINAPLQSSSADITKIAMNKVYDYLKQGGYKTRMVLQIHDEILLESPESEIDIVTYEIQKIMQDVVELKSSLIVDVSVGDSWR